MIVQFLPVILNKLVEIMCLPIANTEVGVCKVAFQTFIKIISIAHDTVSNLFSPSLSILPFAFRLSFCFHPSTIQLHLIRGFCLLLSDHLFAYLPLILFHAN
jgi:hypothetical protein